MRMTSLVFSIAVLLTSGTAEAQDVALEEAAPIANDTPVADELAAAESEPAAIGNDDVVEMHAAGFSASTIIAAIEANATAFDVAPRDLLALKRAGIPEPVIEAMLATKRAPAVQTAQTDARAADASSADASAESTEPESSDAISPEALAQLSRMIEQLAAAPAPAAAAAPVTAAPMPVEPEPQPENPHAPRVWVADGDVRVPIAPTVAKVAYTDMDTKRPAATAFKTLQNFGSKALAFANPTLGAATSGLGDLFRKDDDASSTAVWALLGGSSARALRAGTAFEIDYANVPGVDPDRYRPVIVQLVPTSDNFRLVGAAQADADADTPRGPIIEEPAAADLIRLGRGRYRVALGGNVPPGEYALVLRPIEQPKRERDRRRNAERSLGELMGSSATSQIIYLTWDFSVQG